MAIGYIEQNFGYGRQDKATLWFLRLQDGMGGRQTAMVFTEMSEEAVIRHDSPQPGHVSRDKWVRGMLFKAE